MPGKTLIYLATEKRLFRERETAFAHGINRQLNNSSQARAIDRQSYTENELPQPQLPLALGLLNVKPEPMTELT
jgi:hypothetical protein